MNNTLKRVLLGTTLLLVPYFSNAQALLEAPEQAPSPTQEQVLGAALEGQLETIEAALKSGYDVNSLDPGGRTALMYASYNGHMAVVAKLIEAGADINLKDQGGSTALMFASSGPFVDTVTLLLKNGADINAVDSNEHFSALMWAAAEGQVEIVKLLLKNKADITLKDVDGDTAESFASKAGKFEVVQVLKAAAEEAKAPEKE